MKVNYLGFILEIPEQIADVSVCWIATDYDGTVWCYTEKPYTTKIEHSPASNEFLDVWLRPGISFSAYCGKLAVFPGWKDSLREVKDLEILETA